jgi:hypothetical protein
MCSLQAVPEGCILGVDEPVGSVSLQCCEPEPRGRGLCPWLRPSSLADPPMSRRTCAATKTVTRKAFGDFSRGLRIYRFGSSLWASRVLRRLARGCDRESWEGSCGAFLEPSFVGLSPPSSAPGCAVSAPARAPSATQGYPCSARALRGYGIAPSYFPNILCPQGLCEVLCGCAYCCRCSSQISFSSSRPGSVILNTAP